jgi:hypothetical protein
MNGQTTAGRPESITTMRRFVNSRGTYVRIRWTSLALAAAAIVAATVGAPGVAASGDTMRIEPPSQTVAEGSTFTVRVVHDASVRTSGAQATVTFDRAKVQVTAVTRGTPHAGAAIFAPSDIAGAIASANQTGRLATIATAFIPPDSVPAGDADFLVITFRAVGCGTSSLGLPAGPADAVLLDGREATYGNGIEVTTTGGEVTVDCPGGTPTPAEAPVRTPTPAGGAVDGGTATPPATDTLPFEASRSTDWTTLLLIALAVIIAVVAIADGTRQLTGRRP